jgi:hypothetical protein
MKLKGKTERPVAWYHIFATVVPLLMVTQTFAPSNAASPG